MTETYLNGVYIGDVEDPSVFVDQFKSERRKGGISNNINIKFNEKSNSLHIETTKGRARRPLIVVKDGIPLLTEKLVRQLDKGELAWSDLVQQGVIEFLDASEEENAFIAFTEKDLKTEHTHMEISPSVMFGICASLVPYANHSPPTRINMGAKNQKQALGFYAANFKFAD